MVKNLTKEQFNHLLDEHAKCMTEDFLKDLDKSAAECMALITHLVDIGRLKNKWDCVEAAMGFFMAKEHIIPVSVLIFIDKIAFKESKTE